MGFEIHSYFQPMGDSPLCISVHWCIFVTERREDKKRLTDLSNVKCTLSVGVVGSLRLCSYLCILSWQGVLPFQGEADGLCGWQPTELVGSFSDTLHATLTQYHSQYLQKQCLSSQFCDLLQFAGIDSTQKVSYIEFVIVSVFFCANCFQNV